MSSRARAACMRRLPFRRLGLAGPFLAVALLALSFSSCSVGKISAPRYALLYGVTVYVPNPTSAGTEGSVYPNNLQYCDEDAKALSDILASEGWTVYPRYTGDQTPSTPAPSKQQMRDDLDALGTIPSNATVLFYFSGHGGPIGDEFYLAPYQAFSGTTSYYSLNLANCVSAADLSDMMASLPTKNVIVVLDACFTGAFVKSGSSTDIAPQNVFAGGDAPSAIDTALSRFGDLLSANAKERGKATPIVISAAGSDEESFDAKDPAWGHGVFTYFFLESASNGDSDGDGYVTTSEAYEYSAKAVKSRWNAVLSDADMSYPYYYYPFLPHISGGIRDLVLFKK